MNSGAFPKGKEQDSRARAVLPAEGGLFRMATVLQTLDGGGEVNSVASREGGAEREVLRGGREVHAGTHGK